MDEAAFGCELEGVIDQVPKDLVEPDAISHDIVVGSVKFLCQPHVL
jgi:hypothetical protein